MIAIFRWVSYLQAMFNIGFLELVIIGAVALIVIGPDQLPHVARTLGRLLGDLKKATGELSGGLLDATRDVKKTWQDTQDEVQSATKMALGQDSNGLDESQVDDNQESDTSNKDKSENDDSKESQIEGDDGTENPPG